MRFAIPRKLTVLCFLLGMAGSLAQGRDGLLSVIPDDALGFAVVHNLSDTNRDVGELAKIVQTPVPDLLGLAMGLTGVQKGIDEQGDLAIVLISIDPAITPVVLAPVANFADFFAALNVKEPETGTVEVQIAGAPSLVGRKGSYAAIAQVTGRDALEKFLASTTNLKTDKALAEWVDANRLSVVVTARGIKQLIPKLITGIRAAQDQVRKVGGPNGEAGANAFELYVNLFTAAEKEVEQYGFGVRIDFAHTVDFVKRAQFTADGSWAKWAAKAKPATEDLLGGLEAKPFVFAMGGEVPEGMMQKLMKMSVKLMQNQPGYKITPEQAQKYADISGEMMSGVKSMKMLMGVAEPGTGLYGNTSMAASVENSKGFLEAYEKLLAASRKVAEEINNPAIPVATSQRIKVGETEVLEVSMDMPNVPQFAAPGAPDMQKLMQLMVGPDGKMKYYVALADEHTVVMAYISPDRLKEALEFYQSKKPGLSADASVAKVAEKLPAGSQFIGYMSVGGMAETAKQFMAAVPGAPAAAIPEFPDSPPFGFAAKISPTGVEGHFIVTAETLRSIGDAVAKFRAEARERRQQQEQQQ